MVDGIPYLRVGRQALVNSTLRHLDSGRAEDALIGVLTDQDDWWSGPATDTGQLRQLVSGRGTLCLRDAMALLRMGPVADYFAYRWTDPTYLAGLALVQAHCRKPASAVELACGIGHFLRELSLHEVACTGCDVVFAKCWLARHWVAPEADYVVFDAGAPWPLDDIRYDLVMCHDAFYFLPEQAYVAARLRELVAEDGVLAISHLHNAEYSNGAKGPARSAAEWQSLFPKAVVYDERNLLDSLFDAGTPVPCGWVDDPAIEAWSLIEGTLTPRAVSGGIAMPHPNAALRPNPLLGSDGVHWPSERWRDEYAAGCRWADPDDGDGIPADPIRLRRLVDLPERW